MTGRGEEGHGCYPLTIVMLTGLAGDEIWGEGAGEGGREGGVGEAIDERGGFGWLDHPDAG